jgi:hypothetical protein
MMVAVSARGHVPCPSAKTTHRRTPTERWSALRSDPRSVGGVNESFLALLLR